MDYNKMKKASQLVAQILDGVSLFIKVGISTEDINNYCADEIEKHGAISACKGYKGFPKSVCVSINNKICHGISNKNEILKEGDLVSVDCCLSLDEYFGDSCRTYVVGNYKNIRDKILLQTSYEAMWNAILHIKDGVEIDLLGFKMESKAKEFGFKVVKEFAGHCIGKNLHEDPQIPFYSSGSNIKIKSGMFITIEPMITSGSSKINILSDGWTAVTADGNKASQFEHTIFVREKGYEVLTYSKFDLMMKKQSQSY